jgi:hypothetical protein
MSVPTQAVGTATSQIEILTRSVPAEFEPLRLAIEQSRYMLDLPDNWDEEGSPGYREDVWNRAVTLLLETSLAYWRTNRAAPPFPRLGKGPLGSIDLHWRTDSRELLVNIPASPDSPLSFFGDGLDNKAIQLEGTMPIRDGEAWLLEWLTR